MVSAFSNMQSYWKSKEDAALFVSVIVPSLPLGSPLTMTITPTKSEGYYVTIVTEESLEGIEMPIYSDESLTTYRKGLDGLYRSARLP